MFTQCSSWTRMCSVTAWKSFQTVFSYYFKFEIHLVERWVSDWSKKIKELNYIYNYYSILINQHSYVKCLFQFFPYLFDLFLWLSSCPPTKTIIKICFFPPLHLFSFYMETQLQCMATVVITGFNLRFCEWLFRNSKGKCFFLFVCFQIRFCIFPIFQISLNLSTAQLKVFNTTKLWVSIFCSIICVKWVFS